MIDRRKLAWLIFGLIYGKKRMEEGLPPLAEPLGIVDRNGNVTINPVWYEALRNALIAHPTKSVLDVVMDGGGLYEAAASAQINAYRAHERITLIHAFLELLMLSMERGGYLPDWRAS